MTKDELKKHFEMTKKEIAAHKNAIWVSSKKFRDGPVAKYTAAIKKSKNEQFKKHNNNVKRGPGLIWVIKSAGIVYEYSGPMGLRYPSSVETKETWWGHNGKKAKAFMHGGYVGNEWREPKYFARKYADAGLPKPKPVKDEKCLLKEEIAKLRKDIAKLGKKK